MGAEIMGRVDGELGYGDGGAMRLTLGSPKNQYLSSILILNATALY